MDNNKQETRDVIREDSAVYYGISGYGAHHCIPYESNENLVLKSYNHEDER